MLGSVGLAHAEGAAPPEARVTVVRGSGDPVGNLAREFAALERALAPLGEVTILSPRLLERGDRRALWLAPEMLDERSPTCMTVVALGTRNASFSLEFGDDPPLSPSWPVPSNAGLGALTRCGAKKVDLARLRVQMRSTRGLLEFLVLESAEPPPSLVELLPARDPGGTLPSPRVGPRPRGADLGPRSQAIQEGNARRGAKAQHKSSLTLDRSGQGSVVVTLGPGCHKLDFLATSSAESLPDLDARLSNVTTGEEVARDESESAQAELRHCVGRAERYLALVSGGTPGASVTLLQAEWEMAAGLPLEWGPLAQATMADALWRELPPRVKEPPIQSFLGVQGRTEVWLDTQPDGCYLVGVAVMRGRAHRLVLDWSGGSLDGRSPTQPGRGGTSVAFCAAGASRVRVRVTSSGDGLAWLLSSWEFPERP